MEDMIFGISVGWPMIWIAAAVVFAVIEAFTMGLATIWFCGGAVVAALLAMVGAPISVQITLFFVVSIVLLYFTRPLAQKKLNEKIQKTNADALIGVTGVVTVPISQFSTGRVKLDGKDWTAVSEKQGMSIEKDIKVIVKKIEGVKLIVTPADEIKD